VSHLGEYFRERRVERNLTLGQLARLLGYQNLSKGSNRISSFEAGGKVHPDLLGKLAGILEITPDEVRRLATEDYRDWLAWADVPIRPYLVLRHMACVYQRIELPDDALDSEVAQQFATDLARERKRMVCLVLSRRLSIGFDSTGTAYSRMEATPDMPCEPYLVIGGRRCQFDFSSGDLLRQIDEPRR
jgi:transcriptional regulator with XRE-family HTH domain